MVRPARVGVMAIVMIAVVAFTSIGGSIPQSGGRRSRAVRTGYVPPLVGHEGESSLAAACFESGVHRSGPSGLSKCSTKFYLLTVPVYL
jgi:hypothetical protein